MKILTYEVDHKNKLGVLSEDELWVYPITAGEMEYKDMQQMIEEISDSEIQYLEYLLKQPPYDIQGAVPLEEVKLLAPIMFPKQDIICLGINYMEHAEESARFENKEFAGERPYAVYFSKRVDRAVADGEEIDSHQDMVDGLDYEAELAVIIRKDARNVGEEDAEEYIFGYTVLNDVSARNIQTRHKQWYFGKSLDGFTPMGPWIVTADEIPYPPRLAIQSKVNGELRQDSNTEKLIFGIGYIISELSKGMTLKAGTIISTGTPAGAGLGFDPPKFLKPGDVVECAIEKIGTIKNTVK